MKKVHFHSLDALRFFAFLKVYLLHVPIQGDFPLFSLIKGGGGIGVSFFFVLSGFLITYLLVFEKIQRGHINLKTFFLRRSLRIWPLFYLLVILVFLIPYDVKQTIGLHMVGGGYDLDWKYSFTFLENYKMLLLDNSPKTTPLPVFWSLCIEEHFYLIWMFSLSFLPVKHMLKFLTGGILLAWVSRYLEPHIFTSDHILTNDVFTNLDYFACGGILGYFTAKNYDKTSAVIQGIKPWIKWLYVLATVVIVIYQNDILPYEPDTLFFIFRSSVIAVLFALLIAIFIPKDSSIKIKSKMLSYLGVRSYGLYVYHIIFVHVVFQYFLDHDIAIDNWATLSIYVFITLGASILASALSFRYFESYFLRLREKWQKNQF
jgi:peptidoglycan/LPS O-acetylase OafA/YrhL